MKTALATGGGGIPKTANGYVPIEILASVFGNYPATWWLSGTVVSVGAATLYTSGDVTMYNHMTLQLSGTGTETTTVSASIDGGATFTALILYDANTGALAADGTGLTSNGLYYLDGKYDAVNIVQAGVGTPTVSWAHSVI